MKENSPKLQYRHKLEITCHVQYELDHTIMFSNSFSNRKQINSFRFNKHNSQLMTYYTTYTGHFLYSGNHYSFVSVWHFTSQSTIFQSCQEVSPVFRGWTSTKQKRKCVAHRHKIAPLRSPKRLLELKSTTLPLNHHTKFYFSCHICTKT